MSRIVRVFHLTLVIGIVFFASVSATPVPAIETTTFPDSAFNTIAKLPAGAYMLGGAQSTGSESWETEPGVVIYGGTDAENTYNLDGVNLSDVNEGAVAALSMDSVQEISVVTGGFEAEYAGGQAAILDYQNGGTGVVNLITKSGTNEFRGDVFAYVDESLYDLTCNPDGTLWGAGTVFDPEPIPVLGYFDEAGTFIRADNPLDALGGFFNGIQFMGIGVAFGHTAPSGGATKPLMMVSYDAGLTWEAPPSLPWTYGTIDTAQFVDPYRGWIGGETPNGATFAYTKDGGTTWMSQTMPDATYIWDLEIAMIPVDPIVCYENWILGAALGTHYLDDGSKESIVYRTLDGSAWEELWRVDGYGGDIYFDYVGDGDVAIVQNGLDGTATFSRYAAHDFFGATNLICDMEIIQGADEVVPDEPLTLQLALRDPWDAPITVDSISWQVDSGELVVDLDNPMLATFTASEPGAAIVTCTEIESGRNVSVSVECGLE